MRTTGERHAVIPRAQVESAFSAILRALLRALPLSLGAALVDSEGETVDYAGHIEPFDLKVAAAHFQVVLSDVRAFPPLATVRELRVRSEKRSYLMRVLDPDYSILLVLHRHGVFAVSERALQEAEDRLCLEAGLDRKPSGTGWYRVEVETSFGRPIRLRVLPEHASLEMPPPSIPPPLMKAGAAPRDRTAWVEVEVMGSLMGAGFRERGYRIRLSSGAEVTLLRERGELWFVDEPL